jgi:uncharacterized protein (TIGR03435 family)
MIKSICNLTLLALLSHCGSAQTIGVADAQPRAPAPTNIAFEIADVHPSAATAYPPFLHDGYLVGDRYVLRQATMLDMISIAYGVDKKHVQGGPSWLDWDRFDVVAQAPPSTPPGVVKQMLQSLLKDRFKLGAHEGSALMPAYVLTAVKDRLAMKPSDSSEEGDCKIESNEDSFSDPSRYIQFSCRGESMDKFAERLQRMAPGYLNEPVVNLTRLNGAWDFDLKWTAPKLIARAGSAGISIFDALDKQLGLKLTLGTAPTPALIVDSVNETPSANLPGLDKLLPSLPPAHFEVAVVRPSRPDEKPHGGFKGDQVDVHAFTVKDLIDFVWTLNSEDSETIVGAPKWLDKTRFDILGKVLVDTGANGPQIGPQVDKDQLQELVRELLKDRFKMQAHIEERPIRAYNLVAVRPTLKVADPSSRTRCISGPGPDRKDPSIANPALDRLVSCQNMTMAQFGEALRGWEFGYFFSPVHDATGLKGSWDFTVSFTSLNRFEADSVPGTSPSKDQVTASEPSGTLSLFDAIQRQLGLKLVRSKLPGPVLVIDHIEEQPTPN